MGEVNESTSEDSKRHTPENKNFEKSILGRLESGEGKQRTGKEFLRAIICTKPI